MTLSLRYIKITMVASIALFFSLLAFNNIIDFNSNWLFVQHVMSMDTTFQEPSLMWRSVTNPSIQKSAYYFVILWEAVTAVTCWVGSFMLASEISAPEFQFNESKKIAYIGLFLGFLLFMVGFIVIGREWFSMWQSPQWNGERTAGVFISMIMFVMIFLKNDA